MAHKKVEKVLRALRWGWVGLTVVVLFTLLVIWIMSAGMWLSVSKRWTRGPVTTEPGAPFQLKLFAEEARIMFSHGDAALVVSRYTSFGDTPSDFEQWADHQGWTSDNAGLSEPINWGANHWTHPLDWKLGPVGILSGTRQGTDSMTAFLPMPLLMVLVAAPAGVVVWGWARGRRRLALRRCRACGYDRIGLAPGVPCPECGQGRDA